MTNTRETTIGKLAEGDVVLTVQGAAVKGPQHVVSRVVNIAHGKVRVTRVDFAHGGIVPFYPSATRVTVAV